MTTKRLKILIFTPEGSTLNQCCRSYLGTPLEDLFRFRLRLADEVVVDWKILLFGTHFQPGLSALQEEYDLIVVNLVPGFSFERWIAPFLDALTVEQRKKVIGHGIFDVPEWEFPVVGLDNLLKIEKILASILCPGVTVPDERPAR